MTTIKDATIALLAVLVLSVNGWSCVVVGLQDTSAEAWCSGHRCDYVDAAFDLETPEYASAVERALNQLTQATRQPIVRDDFGIPLRFVPVVNDGNGHQVCGWTNITRLHHSILSIEIEIGTEPIEGCPELWKAVRHEVGCHAIPGLEQVHTASGVCAQTGGDDDDIDALSLGQICRGLDCTAEVK